MVINPISRGLDTPIERSPIDRGMSIARHPSEPRCCTGCHKCQCLGGRCSTVQQASVQFEMFDLNLKKSQKTLGWNMNCNICVIAFNRTFSSRFWNRGQPGNSKTMFATAWELSSASDSQCELQGRATVEFLMTPCLRTRQRDKFRAAVLGFHNALCIRIFPEG